MTETDISVAANGVWRVVGELSFETVPRLLARARQLDTGQSDLIVDLSGVTRANSAGLVLLLEWLDEGRRRQRAVVFRHIPDSIRNIARVSNVLDLLPLAPDDKGAIAAPEKKVGVRRQKRKPRQWR